jgi:hypothetical protein
MVGVTLAITFSVLFIRNQSVSETPRILIPTGVIAAILTLGPHGYPLAFLIAWIVLTELVWTLIVFVTLKWFLAHALRRH